MGGRGLGDLKSDASLFRGTTIEVETRVYVKKTLSRSLRLGDPVVAKTKNGPQKKEVKTEPEAKE